VPANEDDYEATFHDLFAFGRPFRVPLKSDAFQAAALRLFRGV
jgi:hypothetical protein